MYWPSDTLLWPAEPKELPTPALDFANFTKLQLVV
jgi:hypothetical protein